MRITVTDVQTSVPGKVGRKQLPLKNTGEKTAYVGYEPSVTAADGDTQGIPLEPGEWFSASGRDIDVSGPIYAVCAAGEQTTLHYSERA